MNTLKLTLLITTLIGTSAICHSQDSPESTILGELKYLKAENQEVFLAIDSNKKIATKGDDGVIVSSKVIQLAIPNPELGKKAMSLIGKVVECEGRPMAAHTQHHHTEVLWIVSSVEEVLGEAKRPSKEPDPKVEAPTLNPHSVEW